MNAPAAPATASSAPERFAFLGTGPVAVEPYVPEEYFALERERIFRREWLNVALERELPEPGDYVVREVEVCNTSIILVRGEDRRIRAFHNICSHRGNRLVFAERGSAKALTCRYHGWSYTLEGEVRTVTARDRFRGLDLASCALPAVHCESWRGFVFVNFAAQPAQPLRAFLGGWADFAESYPFERGEACVTMRYTLNANWKVALDAFQETYHLGYLHLRTMRNMYFTPEDHSGSYLSADLYGPHRRFSIWANPEHRVPDSAKVEVLARRYGRNINAGAQGEPAITEICPGLNPTRDPKWAWDNAFIFPNVVVTFAAEIWIMSRFWPLAQDRCRWENFTFYPKPKTASERFSREQGVCHLRDVAAEDVDTMEGTTRALKSGARKFINVQESEVAVRHMLHTVEQYVHGRPAEALDGSAAA